MRLILALVALTAACAVKTTALATAAGASPSPAVSVAPSPSPAAALKAAAAAGTSTLTISNATAKSTVVYFAFGADSAIVNWSFCPTTSRLNCQFPLKAHETKSLPLGGKYLNASFSFGATVSCGSTKGEVNLNNIAWYDIADISMVDGFNGKIAMSVTGPKGTTKLGPPVGKEGNEKVFGVFPLGCDICVARQQPPCGMKPGKRGCKSGPDQYHPDVPCQFQGSVMGGGSAVAVSFLGL